MVLFSAVFIWKSIISNIMFSLCSINGFINGFKWSFLNFLLFAAIFLSAVENVKDKLTKIPVILVDILNQWSFCLRHKQKALQWGEEWGVSWSLSFVQSGHAPPRPLSGIRALFSSKSNKIRTSHFSPASGSHYY